MGDANESLSILTPVLYVTIPIALLLLVVCILYARRRYSPAATRSRGYSPVQHGLDEEEMKFKRTMERQYDNIDDIFEGSADSDISFDTKELDRLSMLDKYRDRLVAGGSPDSKETSGEGNNQTDPTTSNESNAGKV